MRKKRWFFQPLLVGGLLLASLVASACSTLNLPSAQQPATPTTGAVVPETGSGPSVTVSDQEFDGKKVVIARVISPGPGWIAIHTDKDGRIGPAVAFSAVKEGENKDVVVEVDPTQATEVMYAMLHTDAGEVGKYEFPGPDVPVTVGGEMISPRFTAILHGGTTGAAGSIAVKDQQVSNGKVVIDEVVSPGPGWVAVHIMGPDGKPDADIGFVHVNKGPNKNVTVTIDASRVTPMMYAMLHSDSGEVGTYEYPGPDGPLEINGQMVVVPFHNGAIAQAMGQAASTPASAQPTAGATQPSAAAPTTASTATVAATATQTSANAAAAATATKAPAPTATTDMAGMHDDTPAVPTQTPAASGGPNAILPYIKVVDQPIVDGTVTVPEVFSLGNSWLVIHRQNPDGQMGVMVGYILVNNGLSSNVVVPVEMKAATPVLYAMLHSDRGVIGKIEFPGADEPVAVRGQMLTPSFKITENKAADIVIDVSKNETGVKHLIDGKGISLYISLNDPPGKSQCTGDCLKTWKPVLVLAGARLIAGVGATQERLGVILLPDGTRQATYAGAPLYTYVNDRAPGDTRGQGIEGNWYLVAP